MAKYHFDPVFENQFIEICEKSISMNQAALKLGMNYKTLCFHAKRLGCFKSNQPGKGIKKQVVENVISLEEIFQGKYFYQSHKLKKRLLKDNIKMHQCESCNLKEWKSFPIPLELHHKDGNRYNNTLANLMLLCPNCHALTDNYRAKNIRNLSARSEMTGVELLKVGEVLTVSADGNPEPSP